MFRKFLIIFIFLFLFSSLFSVKIFSQDQSSDQLYQTFLSSYRNYQTNVEPFKTARSQYQTFQSVDSQLKLLDISKKLLFSETSAVADYARFVRSRLAEATSIMNYDQNYLFVKLDDEIAYFNLTNGKIDGISSLEDIKTLSVEIKNHYDSVSKYSFQVKQIIETGSAKKNFDNLKVEKDKILQFTQNQSLDPLKVNAATNKINDLEKLNTEISTVFSSINQLSSNPNLGTDAGIWKQISDIQTKMLSVYFGYKDVVFSLR